MRKPLAFALVALVACGGSSPPVASPLATTAPSPSPSPSPETFTINGTINGVSCLVADRQPQVIQVYDQTDTLIGQGRSTRSHAGGCSIAQTFTVTDLPRATFYRIDIGDREGPTFSFADLEGMAWRVSLKYGF